MCSCLFLCGPISFKNNFCMYTVLDCICECAAMASGSNISRLFQNSADLCRMWDLIVRVEFQPCLPISLLVKEGIVVVQLLVL